VKIHWGTLIIGLAVGYLLLPQLLGAVSRKATA
jgi:hypothetical protein